MTHADVDVPFRIIEWLIIGAIVLGSSVFKRIRRSGPIPPARAQEPQARAQPQPLLIRRTPAAPAPPVRVSGQAGRSAALAMAAATAPGLPDAGLVPTVAPRDRDLAPAEPLTNGSGAGGLLAVWLRSPQSLAAAVAASEVLGPPVALRRPPER